MRVRTLTSAEILLITAAFAIGACDCSKKGPGGNVGDAMPDAPVGDASPDGPVFFPNCGNSTLEGGETCDDGNAAVGDGCSNACVLEAGWTCPTLGAACIGCGDAIIQQGEVCDDGNQAPNDGCSPTCIREVGWDCVAEVCTPSQCGDGHRVGPEACDDGNYRSGDGCTIRCTIEPGYVCVTENFPCRQTACGDSSVEAQETCDDGNVANGDGCNGTCQLESGHYCPTPGAACSTTTCGDSLVQGLEQCDDGAAASPGCNASCQLEAGYVCPTPGQPCVASTCGNGVREGLEGCDDQNVAAGDGCSATCTAEPFYQCTGATLSVCKKPIEFVRIAKFDAPMDQPQAVHYDPRTRSFVAYDYDQTDVNAAQEFCLDGSKTEVRDAMLENRRDLVGAQLDGAAYDPFRDTFLFVRQDGRLFEINRSNTVVNAGGTQLNGLGTAGGVQVGDDGRIYATNHYAPVPPGNGPGLIRVFTRAPNGTVNAASVQNFSPLSLGTYLDNIFNIPGLGWIGYYNFPNPARGSHRAFSFHTYDGAFVGVSDVPGVLFRNGEYFPDNADGGEAAVDGGYFLVCSEYLTDSDANNPNGICQLFAQTCESSLDCATRVPGTICKLDAPIPYCFAPAVARDDRFVVPRDSTTDLDVMLNDAFSDSVCAGSAPMITGVSTGSRGSAITVGGGGTRVHYVAIAGQCGFVETFTYTANLGGSVIDTATVFVTVPCVCGNSMVEAGEECDDGGTTPGDSCSATCQNESACGNGTIEEGEQCDDDNVFAGDGCSPNCLTELE